MQYQNQKIYEGVEYLDKCCNISSQEQNYLKLSRSRFEIKFQLGNNFGKAIKRKI